MAGLLPAGVICEIMNQDGGMARLPDLVAFGQRHGLKLGTIADLIAHRRAGENFVRRVHETVAEHLDTGPWRVVVYVNTLTQAEHLGDGEGGHIGTRAGAGAHAIDRPDPDAAGRADEPADA